MRMVHITETVNQLAKQAFVWACGGRKIAMYTGSHCTVRWKVKGRKQRLKQLRTGFGGRNNETGYKGNESTLLPHIAQWR